MRFSESRHMTVRFVVAIEVDIVLVEQGHGLGTILANLLDSIFLNRATIAAGSALTVLDEFESIRDQRTIPEVIRGHRTEETCLFDHYLLSCCLKSQGFPRPGTEAVRPCRTARPRKLLTKCSPTNSRNASVISPWTDQPIRQLCTIYCSPGNHGCAHRRQFNR